MAESLDSRQSKALPVDSSGAARGRLEKYKKSGKESEEVRSTRRQVEGIKLRRDERGKELAKRRGINVSSDDVDLQEWKNDTDEDHSQPLSQGGQMDEQDIEQDEIQEQMDSSVVSSCQVMKKEGSPPYPKKQNEEDSYAQETLELQAKLLYSENEEDLLLPAVYFRKFMSQLSQSANPPISSFMELNILPQFVQLLSIAKDPKLHFEAAWVVTNIASGASEHTQKVVDAGAVPALIELLSVKDVLTAKQALFALGNIAGDSPELRDCVLDHGIVPAILNFAEDLDLLPLECVQTLSWVFTNLVRDKPHYDLQKLEPLFGIIKKVLMTKNDMSCHVDMCWTLAFMSDGDSDEVQAVIDLALFPILLELLGRHDTISLPILRIFSNMASGSDDQTQVVVDSGVLARLEHLTHSPKDSIKREVFWMLSNILSGTCQQIQSVIDCGLIPLAVKYLSEGSPPIQKDCCWCLSNLLTSESTDQVRYGATLENLCALCSFLVKSLEDEKVVVRVLQALVSVSKADMEELVIKALDGIGGFERFGHFKAHSNDDIKIWYQFLCYYICEPAEDSQDGFSSD